MMSQQQESGKSLLVTISEIVHLFNSIIEGTECQQKFIAFKKRQKIKQSQEHLGRVGHSNVVDFLKRWKHALDLISE